MMYEERVDSSLHFSEGNTTFTTSPNGNCRYQKPGAAAVRLFSKRGWILPTATTNASAATYPMW